MPEFRAGRFDQGVLNGVVALTEVVRGEFQAPAQPPTGPAASGVEDLMPFVLVFIFLKAFLKEAELEQIESCVRQAERTTRGEIVVVTAINHGKGWKQEQQTA